MHPRCALAPCWNPQHPKPLPPAKTGTSTCGEMGEMKRMLEREWCDHDTDGWIYVRSTWTHYYIYIHIHTGKARSTTSTWKTTSDYFLFFTTSLNFLFELLKIRYGPINSLNWSDHLTSFEIYIFGISSSKSRHSINGKCLIFVTCWH